MSTNTYELTYFPMKGLGNLIRLVLEDQSIDYKFTTITNETWAEHKPKTPFGQMPVLTVNGETHLAQSHSIARYLGREHKLTGDNSLEQTQIEMWIDQTNDIRTRFYNMVYGNYENGKQPFIESIPTELAAFEKQLAGQKNKNYLMLNNLTLADYTLFDLLHTLTTLSAECLDSLPSVKAFHEAFGAREKVAAFLNRDDIKEYKFTGTDHI